MSGVIVLCLATFLCLMFYSWIIYYSKHQYWIDLRPGRYVTIKSGNRWYSKRVIDKQQNCIRIQHVGKFTKDEFLCTVKFADFPLGVREGQPYIEVI